MDSYAMLDFSAGLSGHKWYYLHLLTFSQQKEINAPFSSLPPANLLPLSTCYAVTLELTDAKNSNRFKIFFQNTSVMFRGES